MVTESEFRLVKDDLTKWNLTDSDAAVLTGSRAEGFANENSDFDIYMLVANPESSFEAKRTSLIDGFLYIQYECFSSERASALAQRVNDLFESNSEDALSRLTLEELDRYYRTSIGIPLTELGPQANLLSMYNKHTACQVFAAWTALRGRMQMALSRQMQVLGRAEQSSLAARNCLEWALDSWLARHGEGFPSRKWRFQKFKRSMGRESDVYSRAWELKNIGRHDPITYTEKALGLAEEMGLRTEGLPNLLDIAPRPKSDVATFTIRSQRYIMKNRMRLYALGSISSQVWDAIAAREWKQADMVGLIAESAGLSHEAASTRLMELLDQLVSMEVISWMD